MISKRSSLDRRPLPGRHLARQLVLRGAVVAGTAAALAGPLRAAPFTLRSDDRIVFVGSTLVERARHHGYLETILTSGHAGSTITFRNLGWSADDVTGRSRSGFDPPAEGRRRLVEQVAALRPSVIFLGYGTVESYRGASGVAAFRAELERLIDALGETGARFVLLSPLSCEDRGPPLPNVRERNRDLALYAAAIGEVAEQRGYPFVDLYRYLRGELEAVPPIFLTTNGIHLGDYGYWKAAVTIARSLGQLAPAAFLEIDAGGSEPRRRGFELEELEASPARVRFVARLHHLPAPLPVEAPPPEHWARGATGVLRVRGLDEGAYTLEIDGEPVATAEAAAWARGVRLLRGPDVRQSEELRRLIVDKGFLAFQQDRPANTPYLFGFRKHEQGNNAAELDHFGPLIAARAARIREHALPRARVYELVRARAGGERAAGGRGGGPR